MLTTFAGHRRSPNRHSIRYTYEDVKVSAIDRFIRTSPPYTCDLLPANPENS